jgi:D-alanyl-D-alanine carboxypeptidase
VQASARTAAPRGGPARVVTRTRIILTLAGALLAATACTAAPQPVSATQPTTHPTTSAWPTWSTPTDRALPEATGEALQAALTTYLATQDAPGATAAVVTPDGVWAGASGVDGRAVPLEPRSAMAIGSITKTFVAAEVLLLSSRGEVDLDAPVDDHVDLPFETGGATVREVLGMESGFPPDPANVLDQVLVDLDREWTDVEVLDLVVEGPHQGSRGGEPNYNNLNFLALGALVEDVTGDPLAVALRRDLLDPSGLERVWVQADEQPTPPLAVAADRPQSTIVDLDGPFLPSRALSSAAGAAGGMAADAPSLARWGHLLYGGSVIEQPLVQQMTTPEDDRDWYGLGTELLVTAGVTAVGHGGDIAVYHGVLAVWPANATSVAVLVPGASTAPGGGAREPFGLARTLQETTNR